METALNADKKYFAAHGHENSSRRHVRSFSFFRIAQQGNCFPTCYFVKYSFEFFAYVICSFQNENSFRFVSFFSRFKRSADFFCFSRPFFISLSLPRENILDLILHLSLLHNFMSLMDKFSENLKVQICYRHS